MAITKAAKKAIRQSERKRVRNRAQKQKIKELLKKLRTFISEKKSEQAQKLLPETYKTLDKAAKTGLLKENTVSRTKSRLTKAIARIKSQQ